MGKLAHNGGQIVKEWLISQGTNINRLQQNERINPVIRRRKRGPGGEIAMPTEVHPKVIKKQLIGKIESGEYTMIVPRKYEKLVLRKTNEIVKVEFTTEGRKFPLYDIRRKMLEMQKPFLRDQSSEHYNSLSEKCATERLSQLNELQGDFS